MAFDYSPKPDKHQTRHAKHIVLHWLNIYWSLYENLCTKPIFINERKRENSISFIQSHVRCVCVHSVRISRITRERAGSKNNLNSCHNVTYSKWKIDMLFAYPYCIRLT